MTRLRSIAAAAALLAPAAAFAQVYYVERVDGPYYTERITVYEAPRYAAFVQRESGALQSGGNNLADTLLADSVAMAFARDRTLNGASATVSANNGRVSISGLANQEQSEHARQIARRIAGAGNVSGELSNTGG
jgi:hypothetical protein